MKKTAKSSIAAIIFVIIYFGFIIFLSLFKGINLYNISINNITIKHLFLKIEDKFIVKAENIKIIVKNKDLNKQTIKLHKLIYLSSKLLDLIQEVNIKNLYENNNILFEKIIITKNKIQIKSSNLYTIGNFKINKNYTKLNLKKIKFKNYQLKNLEAFIWINKNFTFLNIKTLYNNKPIFLAIKIDKNDKILTSTYIPNNYIKINNLKVKLNKCYIKSDILFPTKYIKGDATCNIINIKDNNSTTILSKNNKINFNKKYIYLSNKYASIKYFDKKINLYNFNLIFDLNTKNLISEAKKDILFYKNYKIKNNNLAFNLNLNDKSFFIHATNISLNNDINISTKEIVIYKNNKLYLLANNNKAYYKYFKLNTKEIKGDENLIKVSDIIGKVLKFNTLIQKPIINIKNKSIKSKLIQINDINFSNNYLTKIENNITFKTTTNTLLNRPVKDTLKYFKIEVPLTQLKGENKIDAYLNYKIDTKQLNIAYNVISKKSIFNFKDFNFSYYKLNAKGNLNQIEANITQLFIPYKYLYSIIDLNSLINIPNKYINSFLEIKTLNIDKYLNITNYKEKLVIDLKNNFLFLLNSTIFINLNNSTIFLYDLKKLLKYSIFNSLIENGNAIIMINPKKINIFLNILLKYPLILNNPNPKKIDTQIEITKKEILIQNNKFNVEINTQKNIIKAYNHDINLSIEGLINIVNNLQNILKKISTNDSNQSTQTFIKATNTNFIYKNHIFLTQKADLEINKEIKFKAQYKNSILHGYTKKGFLLIEGKNYTKEVLVPLLDFFNAFKIINLDFVLVKSPQDFYIGKVYINKGIIEKLKTLNNLIAFINTIPSLLSLKSPGFSAKGYKIKKGFINYMYYKNIIYFKQILITGENLDFKGKGYIDLSKNLIKLKIEAIIKIKLKEIPIIGKGLSYLLFGKDGYLHANILIKGDLNNPKIEKDIFGNPIETPFTLFKRIITLPFNLF